MKSQLVNILFAVLVLAVIGFVVVKMVLRPSIPVALLCPPVPYTLSSEVTAYISGKLQGRDVSDLTELKKRIAKIESKIGAIKESNVGPMDLAQKMQSSETQHRNDKKDFADWKKAVFKSELKRIRNTMIFQCKPKTETKAGVK